MLNKYRSNKKNMYRKAIGVMICAICFGQCELRGVQESLDRKTEKDVYFEGTPEATLDLYCHINNTLTSQQRLDFCYLIDDSTSLSAKLTIRIRSHEIDTVDVELLYFDKTGNQRSDTANQAALWYVLNTTRIANLPTMMNLPDGSYINRLQMERFCMGYIEKFELGEGTAEKAIKQLNK
jgi:hypothetical protein